MVGAELVAWEGAREAVCGGGSKTGVFKEEEEEDEEKGRAPEAMEPPSSTVPVGRAGSSELKASVRLSAACRQKAGYAPS